MPIKLKIVLAYTVSFALLLTVFSFFIYGRVKKAYLERIDQKIKTYQILLESKLSEQIEDHEINPSELLKVPTKGLEKAKLQIVLGSGKLLIKNNFFDNIKLPESHNPEKPVRKTLEYKDEHYRYYHSSHNSSIKKQYTFEIAASVSEVWEDLNELIYLFLLIIPLALIFTGFIAYLISKAAFKPITSMITTSKNITANNLDERIELPGTRDEVYELGSTLNEMMERIGTAFKSQKQFIADASHEIKTPLTVIQTELELSERKISDPEVKNSIDISLTEIEGLANLTDSLLVLAKIDSSKIPFTPEILRLDELILDCIRLLNKTAQKNNIQLKPLVDEPLEIKGDKEKLRRIFINLLDNAIKYSTGKSVVEVEIKKDENLAEVNIINSGPGISPSEIENIFKRFYRSNEVRSRVTGSGLGLSIVKEFIDMHKGKISVSSEPQKKTVFTVILPLGIM